MSGTSRVSVFSRTASETPMVVEEAPDTFRSPNTIGGVAGWASASPSPRPGAPSLVGAIGRKRRQP